MQKKIVFESSRLLARIQSPASERKDRKNELASRMYEYLQLSTCVHLLFI